MVLYRPKKKPFIPDTIVADILVESIKRELIPRRIIRPTVQGPVLSNVANSLGTKVFLRPTNLINTQPISPIPVASKNMSWLTISDIPFNTNKTKTEISNQSLSLPESVIEVSKIRPVAPTFKRDQFNLSPDISSTDLSMMTPADLALTKIADHIIRTTSQKLDLVFIVDASQSMKNDIESVRLHLTRMTDQFAQKEMDFTIGVIAFRNNRGFSVIGWDFEITAQTKSVKKIEKVLGRIKCRGSEKAKDALVQAANQVKFRAQACRRFILLTDEYASGQASTRKVIEILQQNQISVDILGRDDHFQRAVSQQSNGIWLPISSLRY